MNKLLDNNLFNQEFVPKRHKFCDGRAKSDISLASSAQKRFGMEENMKNRFIGNICSALSLFAFLTVFSALSGCGVVQNNIEESISGNGTLEEHLSQPALSELEQSILLYEEKYADGSADASDVRALAELYGQSDRIRRQRDVLEQAYRLFGDEESLTILEQITVNIAEEETAIAELAQQLYDNLSIDGYFDDGVAMLHDDTWFFTMMPKLDIGHRRYYLEEEDGSLLCLEVGYNENGTRYSAIWLTQSDGEVLHLQKQSDSIYMLQTKLVDGVYQGAYETWLCLASDGDVYHEQGFFENGLSSGSYDCRVYLGSEAADILSLWSNRENFSFISYYGEFDDLGRTTLTQPSSLPEGEIVYAYDASGKKYLTMQAPDSAQTVFDAAFWGLKTYPLFTPYSVEHFEQVDSVDNVTPQIRIYDSNIEWFDGNVWHIAGSVKDFAAADPLGEISYSSILQNEGAGMETASHSGRGSKDTTPEKPASSSAPSSQKPASSSKPAQKPETAPPQASEQMPVPEETPNPAPNPTPVPSPSPGQNPAPEPTPTPTPDPPAPTEPAPPSGGSGDGSDIEWSPDLE